MEAGEWVWWEGRREGELQSFKGKTLIVSVYLVVCGYTHVLCKPTPLITSLLKIHVKCTLHLVHYSCNIELFLLYN